MSNIVSSNATVTTSVAKLIQDTTNVGVINNGQVAYAISNVGDGTVYVGDSSVTTSNGFPIPAGTSLTFDIPIQSSVWAIATESCAVRILKVA
jgi:hypothetical protein